METRANYALIGIFTLAVVAAAFGFVLWFAGSESGVDRATYRVEFQGTVAGLSKGSPVLFNGIRVGEVQGVELSPDAPDQAFATIQIAKTTPIRDDTRASLDVNLLSGVAQVGLYGGARDAGPLRKRNPKDPYPTIVADSGGLGSAIQTARAAAEKANALLDTLNSIVSENRGSISATFRNVESFSEALGKNVRAIDGLLASAGDAAKQIGPMAAKISTLADDAQGIVRAVDPERVRNIVSHTDSLTGKFDQAAGRVDGVLKAVESFLGTAAGQEGKSTFAAIRTAMDAFGRASDNLSRRATEIATSIGRFSGTGSRQVEALGVDARRAINTMGRAAGRIEKNPSSVIFGTGGPSIPEYSGR